MEQASQAPRDHRQDLFRETPGPEIAVYVVPLERGEVTPEAVAGVERLARADADVVGIPRRSFASARA